MPMVIIILASLLGALYFNHIKEPKREVDVRITFVNEYGVPSYVSGLCKETASETDKCAAVLPVSVGSYTCADGNKLYHNYVYTGATCEVEPVLLKDFE